MNTPVGKRLLIYRDRLFPLAYDDRIDWYRDPYHVVIDGVAKVLLDFMKKEFPTCTASSVEGWRDEQTRSYRFLLKWKLLYTAGVAEIQLGNGDPKITDRFVEFDKEIADVLTANI